MNLRSIDLNLLVVLDALLDEAHVSRAALRLNLSQPAVSAALQRCRELFDDLLLERGRGVMYRTPLAERLRSPLKSVLADVETLLAPTPIDIAKIEQVIRVTAADDPTAMLAHPLVTRLAKTAPGISVVFQPWLGQDAAKRELLDGDTDLAITVFERELENIETVTLFETDYVVAMRQDHPAATDFGLDNWLAWPHIVVSGRGERRTSLDGQLAVIGRSRRVALVVPSFQLVPKVLASTDFLAMVPRKSFESSETEELRAFRPPIDVPGFPLHLAWHTRQAMDPALRHVAGIVRTLLS
jgi:DNA-binding transcriptional LysR family regulator